jgi:hypothetical protein
MPQMLLIINNTTTRSTERFCAMKIYNYRNGSGGDYTISNYVAVWRQNVQKI